MDSYAALIAGVSLDNDTLKLLILLLIGLGLFAVARWASRFGGNGASTIPQQYGDSSAISSSSLVAASDPLAVLASFPPDPALGSIRIGKFFFKKIDAIPGPPDPETFADELLIELYDPDSDHRWWQSYFVASPQGLSRVLQETSWKYIYANEVLIFPRYDLEEIRRAVVTRIM